MAKHGRSVLLGVCMVLGSVALATAHEHHPFALERQSFHFGRFQPVYSPYAPPQTYYAPPPPVAFAAPAEPPPTVRHHRRHHRNRTVQVAPAVQAAVQDATASQVTLPPAASSHSIGGWLLAIFALGGLGAGVFYRTTLARWYYELTPHPAAALINHSIRSNEPIDERQLSALACVLPHNAIERDVRATQAHRLAERARRHIAQLMSEAGHEGEYAAAQADLMSATVSHELAQARLDGLQKHTRAS